MWVKEQVYSKNICSHKLMGCVEDLVNLIALKSPNTASHCVRVAMLALEIGNAFNLPSDDMEDLFISSMLHDIGKVLVNDNILNKNMKLTEVEYEIIKGHSKKGFQILSQFEGMTNISKVIMHHHERYDGNGYPNGLKGKQIPFLSRIIAVADSFDAMVSNRPYRSKMNIKEAIKELERNKSLQFDRDITSVFLYLIRTNKIVLEYK